MATAYKVLGQVKPTASTETTLYTVPSATNTVVSTITVLNMGTQPCTFNIAVRPAGAAVEDKHYVLYGAGISSYQSQSYTIGITLATTDVISINTTGSSLVANLFGSEIS